MMYYKKVTGFLETNHRNISIYNPEERWLYTGLKHNRKQMNAGELKGPRSALFKDLLALGEKYRRKNQYE